MRPDGHSGRAAPRASTGFANCRMSPTMRPWYPGPGAARSPAARRGAHPLKRQAAPAPSPLLARPGGRRLKFPVNLISEGPIVLEMSAAAAGVQRGKLGGVAADGLGLAFAFCVGQPHDG